MARIQSFKELRVWQEAMDLAMSIFERTKTFPKDERFSLIDQFRRSSRSVPSNISEAWHKRRYPAAFIAKLSDAEGEAAETQTWVEVSLRCRYIPAEVAVDWDNRSTAIIRQLIKMASRPQDWVIH